MKIKDMALAVNVIKFEEGFKSKPYLCSEGYPTFGYGLRIGSKNQSLDDFKHLPEIPEDVASLWLASSVYHIYLDIFKDDELYFLQNYDKDRLAIVVSMVYQLGTTGFKKFEKTIDYLESYDFLNTSIEMMDSLWALQTPNRAERHSKVMLSGNVEDVYGEYN